MSNALELVSVPPPSSLAPLPNQPPSPQSSTWRGKCVSIIYLPIFCGLLVCAIGSVYSGVTDGSSLYTVAFTVAGVALIISLILVCKYGDISRITSRIQAATHSLTNQVQVLTQTKAQLAQENIELKGSVKVFQDNNAQLEQSLKDFDPMIDGLKDANEKLSANVAQLQQVIGIVQSKTAELKQRNAAFNDEIRKISAQVPLFHQINIDLEQIDREFSNQFEKELTELDQEIQRTQILSKQLIETLQKEAEDLQSQIKAIQAEENGYSQENDRLAAEVSALKSLSDSAGQTDTSLTVLMAQLKSDLADLKQQQESFAKEKEEFLTRMETDRAQLTQETARIETDRKELEALQASFAQTVHEGEDLNRQIEAGLKALEEI